MKAATIAWAQENRRWAPSAALAKDDAVPCDGCAYRPACMTGLCCDRFAHWMKTGKRDTTLSDAPSESIYAYEFRGT
jgi:hypothetical protein